MSILSDFERIRTQIGYFKYDCIEFYIDQFSEQVFLHEIVYNEENFKSFETWFLPFSIEITQRLKTTASNIDLFLSTNPYHLEDICNNPLIQKRFEEWLTR